MTWPEIVWSAPALRGLDARAQREIEAAGELVDVARGASVFKSGEPADAFYVVVRGACALRAIVRGDAGASVVRSVARGETFGEEATLPGHMSRALDAVAEEASAIACVPVIVYRRALGRSGAPEAAERLERALRRTATRDLLRTTSFARDLSSADLEVVLDAVDHMQLARNETLFRAGEDARFLYVVADGMLQLQSDDDGSPRVEAYVSRGDLVGDDAADAFASHAVTAVAVAPSWALAIRADAARAILAKNKGLRERLKRVTLDGVAVQRALIKDAKTTAHVFKDLYRLRTARSLLVIDSAACVRCGHCASSCASVHDDGVSRLVRRGDKLVARLDGEDPRPLILPNSCQHCKNPSCMTDCPTGAIGRDARGEVFIREDLCTGCGNCAKGCPWDNIRMADRTISSPQAKDFPEVAVKCDLCTTRSGGPACVEACPTEAIARVDPSEAFAELRVAKAPGARGREPGVGAGRRAAWPAAFGGVALGGALSLANFGAWTSGLIAGAAFLGLVAYAARKRIRLPSRKRARAGTSLTTLSTLRPWYVAHLALGALASGAIVSHAGAHVPGDVRGALAMAAWGALATGILGAVVYALVPRALARVEQRGLLPEDFRARSKTLDDRSFSLLSGKSDVVKTLWRRILEPYARARFGWITLVFSGRTARTERARIATRIATATGGRTSERLQGLPEIIELVVERRALRAQRWLHVLVRAWLAPHVALALIAIVLLAVHVVLEVARK